MGPTGDGMGWRKEGEGRSEGGVLFTLQFPCKQGMNKCERGSERASERERGSKQRKHTVSKQHCRLSREEDTTES